MIIKIGKFNFVSENKEEFRLFQDNSYSMFSYFYMDGKEDTLYVHSRSWIYVKFLDTFFENFFYIFISVLLY